MILAGRKQEPKTGSWPLCGARKWLRTIAEWRMTFLFSLMPTAKQIDRKAKSGRLLRRHHPANANAPAYPLNPATLGKLVKLGQEVGRYLPHSTSLRA